MPRWAVAEEAFTDELDAWRTTRDEAAREAILVHYFPLCAVVAKGLAARLPPHIDEDELTSLAVMGLFRAVDRYDPSKVVIGVTPSFWKYAVMCMRSTMLDGVRAEDWAPRSLRRRQKQLEESETELHCKFGRDSTVAELSMRLGWSPAQIRNTRMEVAASWHTHLEDDEVLSDEPSSDPYVGREQTDHLRAAVVSTVGQLTELQQAVVAMRYYEEKSLAEIALALGVSKAEADAAHGEAVSAVWEAVKAAAGA